MKYALLIDGGYHMYNTLHVCGAMKKSALTFSEETYEDDKNLFLWKLAMNFSSDIKKFSGVINRVVYCLDHSSWRKQLFPEYKGNRSKSSTVNWDAVHKVHNEFVSALAKLNVHVSQMPNAEADDFIYAWTKMLQEENDNNCIIVSGDGDLTQLISVTDKAHTIYYDKDHKRILAFEGFEEWLNTESSKGLFSDDIFDTSSLTLDLLKSELLTIMRTNGWKINHINRNEFLFIKILTGDKGDNVPSINNVIKNGKTFTFTEKKSLEVLNEYKMIKSFVHSEHFEDSDCIDLICEIVKTSGKIAAPVSEIRQRWELNNKLMHLHSNNIPGDLWSKIKMTVGAELSSSLSSGDRNLLENKLNILKLTSYESNDYSDVISFVSDYKSTMAEPTTIPKDVKVVDVTENFDDEYWSDFLK